MNNKKKTKAQRSNYQKYFPMIIFISILFMSVGYAVINSINLNIDGEAIAKEQSGVYITEATYHSNVSANTSSSKINSIVGATLDTTISLSSTKANSSITYSVTLYNSTDKTQYFYNVDYLLGEDTYSNEGITFELSGLEYQTSIASKSYLTFTLTFKYANSTLSQSNTLNSMLNFTFVESTNYTIQSVHGDYTLTTTCTAGNECQNMTVNDFILSVDKVVIPEPAHGTMTISKTYDPSTGKLTFKRSSLIGQNFITYSGKVHMIKNPKLVATASGNYSISINLTSLEKYSSMTADDFYYEITQLIAPEAPYEADSETMGVSGDITISKSYNASTGILTIQRSSIKGTGTLSFEVNVYIVK